MQIKNGSLKKREDSFNQMFVDLKQSGELDVEAAKINIAEEIFRAMERQKITKAMLAGRLGTSRAYVTKVLQGTANFTIESLVKIGNALGCSLEFQMIQIAQTKLKASVNMSAQSPSSCLKNVQWEPLSPIEKRKNGRA